MVFSKTHFVEASPELILTADAAVLMDYQTGHILYGLNASKYLHPASTTKILTSILGLELGIKKEVVNVASESAGIEGTSLYLKEGEKYYLYDLIKGALINSGNDAASAIAEHIGSNERFFSSLMTYKAKTIGALRSHFYNPHGLTHDSHLTTAYDLALITRYALKNKDFKCIVGTKSGLISEIQTGKLIPLYNTNQLLWDKNNQDNIMRVIGVKTGTTEAAGQCLIAAAQKGNKILISVVLHSDSRYDDTINLLNYGFKNCYWFSLGKPRVPLLNLPVYGGEVSSVPVGLSDSLEFSVNLEELSSIEKRIITKTFLKAPLKEGTNVGKIEVYFKEHYICSTDLIALTSISKKNLLRIRE